MKLTILSDIHDNVWNLQKILAETAVQKTEALLFCGDLCAPFVLKLLGQNYANPIHAVLGNNDGDLAHIIQVAGKFPNINLHGEYFRGELGGCTIAMNHYPDKGRLLAESGMYDIVCYGHDHQLNADEKIPAPSPAKDSGPRPGREEKRYTLLLNPGAVMGYNGAALKEVQPSYLILDTDAMEAKVYQL